MYIVKGTEVLQHWFMVIQLLAVEKSSHLIGKMVKYGMNLALKTHLRVLIIVI